MANLIGHITSFEGKYTYTSADSKEKEVEVYEGMPIYADDVIERSQIASTCGNVLDMGSQTYDKEKFPEGPWCKKGDWVMFARYAGSRIKIEGGEVRLLNDDEILATIKSPEDLLHEF